MIDEVKMMKEAPEWHKKMNPHFNHLPPNWRELSDKEFAESSFTNRVITHIEFRQAPLKKGGVYENIKMFYLGGPQGIAMVQDYWAGKTRYFRFALCVHDWQEVNREGLEKAAKKFPHLEKMKGTWGYCCHNEVCSKCGDYRFIDSSD